MVASGATSASKKVDVDAIPQIGGQSLLEFDLDEAAAEKPWRLPGVQKQICMLDFVVTALGCFW